jgi:hypothetical protein
MTSCIKVSVFLAAMSFSLSGASNIEPSSECRALTPWVLRTALPPALAHDTQLW